MRLVIARCQTTRSIAVITATMPATLWNYPATVGMPVALRNLHTGADGVSLPNTAVCDARGRVRHCACNERRYEMPRWRPDQSLSPPLKITMRKRGRPWRCSTPTSLAMLSALPPPTPRDLCHEPLGEETSWPYNCERGVLPSHFEMARYRHCRIGRRMCADFCRGGLAWELHVRRRRRNRNITRQCASSLCLNHRFRGSENFVTTIARSMPD
jgi:hypothetical protein